MQLCRHILIKVPTPLTEQFTNFGLQVSHCVVFVQNQTALNCLKRFPPIE
ncbi:unnamed protein product, partial [Allacma fusca]